jgi:hypothetical protein
MAVENKLIKIAVISEHSDNDGKAIITLLKRYFPDKILGKSLHKGGLGSRVKNQKTWDLFKANYKLDKPDFVLIIRDLDNDDNKKERQEFFKDLSEFLSCQSIFLLFVYQIEALAVIDWQTTQEFYSKTIKHKDKPNNSKSLVDKLENLLSYEKCDMQDLVKYFNKQILYQNYPTWKVFINEMAMVLNAEIVF